MSSFVELVLLEPETNLMVCAFNRVGSVADVTANLNTEITSDGSRKRVTRAGFTEQLTTRLDDVSAFPHHAHNRA